ncbi:MAG TPA: hydroxyacylglutathione hydrolase [Aestuariivirgaceae bacterium]|jgi:hydroxyacylglutathione hydrolase
MASLEVSQFPVLSDNYGVLLHDPASGQTASIDAADAAAVDAALKARGWSLTHVLVTHHHSDHTDGVLELKQAHGAAVYGPARDTRAIPGLDRGFSGGDRFSFAGREVSVIFAPGHTKGHIVYHLPADHLAFVGDVLFSLGCGRVIEGTMQEMWTSLDALRRLPPDTSIYCGHEYTLANARFALTVEPGNEALRRRAEEVAALRAKSLPTLPTTMAAERAANPFLRPDSEEIRTNLNMVKASDAEVFAELRERKNRS